MDIKKNGLPTLQRHKFGYELKAIRKRAKLTQQELATQLSISRETVSALENNKESAIKALPVETLIEWYALCSKQITQTEKHSFVYSLMRFFN